MSEAMREATDDNRVVLALRVLLGVLTVSAMTVGAWAAFAPRSFYDDFPGLGQVWVAVDGPYNEHLVRDVGALNLALAAVTVCALLTLSRPTILAAALGWLVYGIPHVIYHARHLDVFDSAEGVAVIASVSSTSVVALAVVWLERSRVARV
ncbi:MAG: hypothetical protein QOF28_1130 [Actinomycetota bacterium]|nr:hypothetical protein [Actinomycetota bacterium]